ncbi:glycosyltransferase [Vibrio hangzhouensis]|uniref:Glycosyltransferase involved in cell wall bisynthesis n=1 Tax=Vibrio hangzhouensis TaxID=462991 RepID=A0A1H5ZXP9_9VIBR|nr:glycosyltransferase [Vibrio hangzhouensis]SEG41229.1 Glycosyltransferase involved in cell wall bisynthesis [Vibrio hangzhouensis]
MKTLGYVLSDFPVLSETFVGTEMRAMIAQGYRVRPLAFNVNPGSGQPADSALVDEARTITHVSLIQALSSWLRSPIRSCKAIRFVLQQTGLPKKSLIRSAGQLAYIARKQHCDHLHAHFALHTTATAITAAKLLDCQVSFVGHGFDVYAQPADLPLKLSSSSFAIAVCKDMQQRFRNLSPTSLVHLVACGIELQRYPFRPVAKHNGRLLFVGRLTEKKGLSDLFEGLALLPESDRPQLDLVGDGELKSDLNTLAKKLGIDEYIHFLGSRHAEWIIANAAHYIALCTPFCEAKNGDRDTGPVVVKEAMALGLPVICSQFMGCEEMVTEDTGVLVPPKAPPQLATAITAMRSLSEVERLKLVQRARNRVSHFYSATVSGIQLAKAIEGAC